MTACWARPSPVPALHRLCGWPPTGALPLVLARRVWRRPCCHHRTQPGPRPSGRLPGVEFPPATTGPPRVLVLAENDVHVRGRTGRVRAGALAVRAAAVRRTFRGPAHVPRVIDRIRSRLHCGVFRSESMRPRARSCICRRWARPPQRHRMISRLRFQHPRRVGPMILGALLTRHRRPDEPRRDLRKRVVAPSGLRLAALRRRRVRCAGARFTRTRSDGESLRDPPRSAQLTPFRTNLSQVFSDLIPRLKPSPGARFMPSRLDPSRAPVHLRLPRHIAQPRAPRAKGSISACFPRKPLS